MSIKILNNRYAIDTMQSICLKEAGLNASDSLEEETTLIGLTFGGYLRSKVSHGHYNFVQNARCPSMLCLPVS